MWVGDWGGCTYRIKLNDVSSCLERSFYGCDQGKWIDFTRIFGSVSDLAVMALITHLLILYASCLTLVSAITLNSFPNKPRVFVLSDISNEPDDSESFVRYLTYSNQFQTEGIVATTSTWLKNETDPDAMLDIIDAYGKVVDNLNHHAPADSQYPSAEHMRSLVRAGSPVYSP